MKLAIFDLDGTLLPIDAGHQWVHFLGEVCGEDLSREVARQDQFAVEYKEGCTVASKEIFKFAKDTFCVLVFPVGCSKIVVFFLDCLHNCRMHS